MLKTYVFILSSILFSECATVYSDFQSAKTVGKNNFEIMPTLNLNRSHFDWWEKEFDYFNPGIHITYGFSNNFDMKIRYENIYFYDIIIGGPDSEIADVLRKNRVFAISPKYAFIKNKVSFALPTGFSANNNKKYIFETQPTLILTIPINRYTDLSFAPKYIIRFNDNSKDNFAINLNFSFSKKPKRYVIRPEFGMLFTGNKNNFYTHFGLGYSYIFKI